LPGAWIGVLKEAVSYQPSAVSQRKEAVSYQLYSYQLKRKDKSIF
jgi:hypothetical protein